MPAPALFDNKNLRWTAVTFPRLSKVVLKSRKLVFN